jgi:hypothetical protein
MRLLLKVLALSDMAIYVARSNRLNSVMIDFLAEASRQYLEHFAVEVGGEPGGRPTRPLVTIYGRITFDSTPS